MKAARHASAGFEVLCDLVAALDPASTAAGLNALPEELIAAVTAAAREHAVEAWLAGCLPPADERWSALHQQRPAFAANRLRQRAEITRLGVIFSAIEAPWVVLKGAALAHAWFPRPDLRDGVDIDLLVEPARLRDVVRALESGGYELLDRNWPLIAELLPGELKLRSASGVLIDLHWHLLNHPRDRVEFSLPTSHLIARREPMADFFRLSATDQLLHLGLHGSHSGANRLGWLLDAALVLPDAQRDPDWLDAARRGGVGLPLSLVLAGARRIFGIEVTRSTLLSLSGRPWLLAEAAVDRISPMGQSSQLPSLRRSFALSVRSTQARSVTELGRHARKWVSAGARRSYEHPTWRDPAHPESVMFVNDDRGARESYFAKIEASG